MCRARFGKSGFDLGDALFRDQVWMFGHRPIRQVLDGVGVLFLYKGSAHVGVKLTGFREGSTFHRKPASASPVLSPGRLDAAYDLKPANFVRDRLQSFHSSVKRARHK